MQTQHVDGMAMTVVIDLTAEYLRSILDYNRESGVFTWKRRPIELFEDKRICFSWNSRFYGKVAGSPNSYGYVLIRINRHSYKAHRLAWLYETGEWPVGRIDHENLKKDDNRLSNLRLASQSQNMANINKHTDNKSGFKGVSWNKRSKKWEARISVKSKLKNLGLFSDPSLAYAAYCSAAEKHFGEFARV